MSDKRRHHAGRRSGSVFGLVRRTLPCGSSQTIERDRLQRGRALRRRSNMSEPLLRVVLVEDSPRIRARIAESLSEMPNVRIAGEAETEGEAISLLDRGDWDAVVLDLQLKQGSASACSRHCERVPVRPARG